MTRGYVARRDINRAYKNWTSRPMCQTRHGYEMKISKKSCQTRWRQSSKNKSHVTHKNQSYCISEKKSAYTNSIRIRHVTSIEESCTLYQVSHVPHGEESSAKQNHKNSLTRMNELYHTYEMDRAYTNWIRIRHVAGIKMLCSVFQMSHVTQDVGS